MLEQLHPGASQRISAQAERLAEELDQDEELVALALAGLQAGDGDFQARARLPRPAAATGAAGGPQPGQPTALLQHWLSQHNPQPLSSRQLETLLARLVPRRGPGRLDLAGGWRLCWDRSTLTLLGPTAGSPLHD